MTTETFPRRIFRDRRRLRRTACRRAQADSIRMLNEAGISENILRYKGLDALKDVADGQATKIYMPSDIASVISTLGIAGDAFREGAPGTAAQPGFAPGDPCLPRHESPISKETAATNARIEQSVSADD